MLRGQQRIGVEFKRADVPTITKSMRISHARPEAGRAVRGVPRPVPLPHGRRRGGGAAVAGVALAALRDACITLSMMKLAA